MTNESAQGILDVAIVGAGVSGVYSGWRLLETRTCKNVALFECSHRIGGRLLSVQPPGMPDTRAELGGMRILPDRQPRIKWVVEHFDIKTYPFPVDEPANIAYLRDVHLRLSEFSDPKKVPYNLRFLERGKSAGQLVIDAINQIVPGATTMTDAERREAVKTARFGGRLLSEQGFWQALYQVMSPEAYALASAAGGYLSTLNSWNAADAVPWFLADFGDGVKYEGFTHGFQEVPLKIAAAFQALGGLIQFDAKLESFDRDEQGLIHLNFGHGKTIKARALILAMPRRSLELIAPTGVVMQDPNTQALLRSVTPQPLFKLFTAYRNPWWLAASVQAGRTVSDLPIRQTYYWPLPDGSARTQGNALLMASYDDGNNIDFWSGYRPKRGLNQLPESMARHFRHHEMFENKERTHGEGQNSWENFHAPKAMVAEIQRQAAQVHGLSSIEKPYAAAFMDWGDDPYGGGWNSWNIGVQSSKVEKEILQPVSSVPVYICGEAYSQAQGWVEGALDTADQMLAKAFQISAPSAT